MSKTIKKAALFKLCAMSLWQVRETVRPTTENY